MTPAAPAAWANDQKTTRAARWFSLGATGHGPGDDNDCPNRNRGYRAPQSLIDEITTLYPTCTHVGCSRPATRCDADHMTNYTDGGPTCICNMHPVCRFHHRLKTHGGWAASFTTRREPAAPGTVAWTSRYGQTIHVPPVTLPGSNDWRPADRPSGSQDATMRSGGNSEPALDSTDSAVADSTDSTDSTGSSASSNATQVGRQALSESRWRSELDRISGTMHHDSVSPTPRAPKPNPAEPPI